MDVLVCVSHLVRAPSPNMYPSGVDCPPRDNAQPRRCVAPVTLGNGSTRRIVADHLGRAEKCVEGDFKTATFVTAQATFFSLPVFDYDENMATHSSRGGSKMLPQ